MWKWVRNPRNLAVLTAIGTAVAFMWNKVDQSDALPQPPTVVVAPNIHVENKPTLEIPVISPREPELVKPSTFVSPEDSPEAIELLLRDCEKAYQDGRKYDKVDWLERHCFEQSSDARTAREFWEPPGSPQYIQLSLDTLVNVQQSIAEGFITVKPDGEESRKAKIRFKKTSNGWRIASHNLFK